MEVTNIIINVSVSLVVGGGAGLVVFKWLGKKWLSHWFDKDLEKYKQQLELLKMQKHLQFSNVYVQRAEVIREVYRLLARLAMADQTIKGVIFKDEDEEQKTYQEYLDGLRQLYLYSIDNGIYLPQPTFSKLMAFTDSIGKELFPKITGYNEVLTPETIELIKNIPDYDLGVIIKELKSEFQILLGIEEK